MALPRKYQQETDIPPALREYYTQADDGSWVLDLEGEGAPDVTKLQNGIKHEREQRRKAIEELTRLQEQYKDLDPDRAREALAKIEELEEQQANSGKKAEEIAAKRFERQIKELQTQITALTESTKEKEAKIANWRERYARVAIEDRLSKALLDAGADPKKVKFAVMEARPSWRLNDDDDNGEPVPMDADGNLIYGTDPTRVLTMAEHAKSILKDYPFFGLESSGGNTQQRSGVGNGIGGVIRLTPEQAKNPRLYRQAKEQAERTGATLDLA